MVAMRGGDFIKTKLCIVEGIPGSGKSTTAKWLYEQLKNTKQENMHLFNEGNLDHPADYESVAFLTKKQYSDIIETYQETLSLLMEYTERRQNGNLVYYGKLGKAHPEYQMVVNALSKYDIYECPVETYMELTLTHWKEFEKRANENEDIYIFECCFLQNPTTMLIGKNNMDVKRVKEFIKKQAEIIQSLQPLIIYLKQENVQATLDRAVGERPQAWADGITEYFTQQGYGLAHGLSGYSGLVEVLKYRRDVELSILNELDVDQIVVDNTQQEWDQYYTLIQSHLVGHSI